jgi:hypothetical protein
MPIVQHPNAVSFSDLVAEFGGGGGVPEDQLPWVLASNPG